MKGASRGLDMLAAGQHAQPVSGHRTEFAPKAIHVGAVKPCGAGQQLGWINHVGCAALVHVGDGARKAVQQRPRRTRMIQMDVRQQQRVDVLEPAPHVRKTGFERRQT